MIYKSIEFTDTEDMHVHHPIVLYDNISKWYTLGSIRVAQDEEVEVEYLRTDEFPPDFHPTHYLELPEFIEDD